MATPMVRQEKEWERMRIAITLAALASVTCMAGISQAESPIVVNIYKVGALGGLTGTTASGNKPITYNQIGDDSSIGNLYDISGNQTGYGLAWVAGNANALNSNGAGYMTGDAAAIFPDNVGATFLGSSYSQSMMRWRLDGLDPNKTYNFDFYSSRSGGFAFAYTKFTLLGENSVNGTINAKGNPGGLLHLEGVSPDAFHSIAIEVTFGTGNNAGFTYFNAFQMTSVPEPSIAGLSMVASGLGLLRRRRKVI